MGSFEQELTDEGKQMFKNLAKYEEQYKDAVTRKGRKIVPEESVQEDDGLPVVLPTVHLQQLNQMIEHLLELRENSVAVIADCQKLMSKYKTKEEYLASEPKVAMYCHQKLIERIDRILNGENPL